MRTRSPYRPRGLARLAPAKGFTLVEMLVSIAIFTIVMTTALGALLSMSEADRKAQTINSAVNNLSFAMESMSRTIRTGQNYHCGPGGASGPQDCGSPSNVYSDAQPYLSFDVTDGSLTGCTAGVPCAVIFCLSSGTALSCNASTACDSGSSCSILRSINGSAFAQLTAPEVEISSMGFYTKGAPSGDGLQPKVNILISGSVPVSGTQRSAFNLQTSVTQRLYDQ